MIRWYLYLFCDQKNRHGITVEHTAQLAHERFRNGGTGHPRRRLITGVKFTLKPDLRQETLKKTHPA